MPRISKCKTSNWTKVTVEWGGRQMGWNRCWLEPCVLLRSSSCSHWHFLGHKRWPQSLLSYSSVLLLDKPVFTRTWTLSQPQSRNSGLRHCHPHTVNQPILEGHKIRLFFFSFFLSHSFFFSVYVFKIHWAKSFSLHSTVWWDWRAAGTRCQAVTSEKPLLRPAAPTPCYGDCSCRWCPQVTGSPSW